MGYFNNLCAESSLVIGISDRQRLIPIVESRKGRWVPLGLPIVGTNNELGTMTIPKRLDDAMKRLVALGRTFVYGDNRVVPAKVTLENVLDEIRADGSGATWNGKQVSFSLIDAAVFDAIVGIVKAGRKSAWIRYAKLVLGDRGPLLHRPADSRLRIDATTKRLARALLDIPADEATRRVLLDHLLQREDPFAQLVATLPVLGKLGVAELAELALPETHAMYNAAAKRTLKPAMVELVRFLAWGTRLLPAAGETRFYGYVPTDPESNPDAYSKPYSDHARGKYAGMPELIPAIERNEKRWKEYGAEYS